MNRRTVIALCILALVTASAHGQTLTTGQISGTVTDPSGAAVPKAQVTVSNTNTGIKRTTESNSEGYYVVPLLDHGTYVVTIAAKGFETVSREGITVAVSRSALVDFRLQIGAEEIKVTISAAAPLMEPSNPNITTTFNASLLTNLPNPGNDLSYVANLTPGAVINVSQGGGVPHGNFEFNGQPSTANDFTVDGLDVNNTRSGVGAAGSSGLQLGLNAIEEVSVNTSAYSVAGGRASGSYIDFVTKSGSNGFHGNLYEVWNGSVMNANNYFLNATGGSKPHSNVNEFGASLGGRIKKDKLFFFTDVEGIRLISSQVSTTTLPTAAYQSYVLQQLPLGGGLDFGFFPLPPEPAEVPFYQNMFKLIGNTSRGNAVALFGCPFDVGGGTPTISGAGNGCANKRTFSLSPPTSETLFTTKLDYVQSRANTYWFRFQSNDGSRIIADPVSSVFDIFVPTSERRGSAGWTHVFGTHLVNQFNPGISYYSNASQGSNPTASSTFPIEYGTGSIFSPIGHFQSALPAGTAITTWQLNDSLTWTTGRHSFQFGDNFRRVLDTVTNASLNAPLELDLSVTEFTYGATGTSIQTFRSAGVHNRLANVNLDLYAMDTFKVNPKLTLTIGLRTAWNSDPVSQSNQFSRLNGSFASLSHDVNRPLNLDILPKQAKLWGSTPLVIWQPRAAAAYQFASTAVVRAGFGVFTTPPDLFFLNLNPPSANQVSAGLFGSAGGIAIAPNVPGSAFDAAIAANQRFQQNFTTGGLSCASPQASPATCISPFLFQDIPSTRFEYPYSMEWSAGVEKEFLRDAKIVLNYVGTRSVKGSFFAGENIYQTFCQGCFAPVPFSTPTDKRFGEVQGFKSGANSSYHALQITGQKRMSRGLQVQANYTYSHCLDTVSNAGADQFYIGSIGSIFPPDDLRGHYGNCDYDVRHSFNGFYVYQLPFHSASRFLNHMIGGWQVSGTVFLRGGFPISVLSTGSSVGVKNGGGAIFANSIAGQSSYSKAPIPTVTLPGTIQWLNPSAFQSVINPKTLACYPANTPQNCQQGNLSRNALRGPDFRWTDLSITKSFKVSERIALRFDTQFYNLFNHPNFGLPSKLTAGIPGVPSFASSLVGFGAISQTVSPATGLLGSGLGGDSSVRMIALRGRIEF